MIADDGLLSGDNIATLETGQYSYIIGARLKNESDQIKQKIHSHKWSDSKVMHLRKDEKTMLIVAFSHIRATEDQHSHNRRLKRLQIQIKAGTLTKSNLNNKGYHKYLKLQGKLTIEIDYAKFKSEKACDGLKGNISNTKLSGRQVNENYNNLGILKKHSEC